MDEHQVPVGRITDIDSVVPLKVTVGADASPRQFGVQIVSPLPADRRKGQVLPSAWLAKALEDHHFQTPLGKVVGAAGADDAGADNGDVELCSVHG